MTRIRDVVIVGAGAQGLVVADILLAAAMNGDPLRAVAIVDDHSSQHGGNVLGILVTGGLDVLSVIPHDGIVVAVGDNRVRRALSERLAAAGETLITARHPTAVIAAGVVIGIGSMISAGATVTPEARIGAGVLLNTRCIIDHQTIVGDFAHISAGGTVGGSAEIGEEALIALGASVVSGCRVGARSIVGAGAVVVRDLPADVVAWGVPARIIRPHIRSPF